MLELTIVYSRSDLDASLLAWRRVELEKKQPLDNPPSPAKGVDGWFHVQANQCDHQGIVKHPPSDWQGQKHSLLRREDSSYVVKFCWKFFHRVFNKQHKKYYLLLSWQTTSWKVDTGHLHPRKLVRKTQIQIAHGWSGEVQHWESSG